MVVSCRLAWIRRLVARGVPASITTGPAATAGQAKVKIIVNHNGKTTSVMQRTMLLESLDAISWRAWHSIAVDRGHRHASTGQSEVCIWLRNRCVEEPEETEHEKETKEDTEKSVYMEEADEKEPRRNESEKKATDEKDDTHENKATLLEEADRRRKQLETCTTLQKSTGTSKENSEDDEDAAAREEEEEAEEEEEEESDEDTSTQVSTESEAKAAADAQTYLVVFLGQAIRQLTAKSTENQEMAHRTAIQRCIVRLTATRDQEQQRLVRRASTLRDLGIQGSPGRFNSVPEPQREATD
mmetsp:Transcript_66081/g.127658  ORF Transcript_66081/g.127658 Transcript_66081/m.127658 type:complete len:299 (+) Transcript_66081:75-971(+)